LKKGEIIISNFFELVEKRESCRDFSDKRPTKEMLIKCIEAARKAPSACNSQPWKFYVVNDEKISLEVAKATQDMGMNKFASNCPSFIVVCEEKANLLAKIGERLKNQQFAQGDVGIAVAHICYAAVELGMSTCILGWLNEKKLKELLSISEASRVRMVIAIGFASDKPLREKKRKSLDEIMTYIGE